MTELEALNTASAKIWSTLMDLLFQRLFALSAIKSRGYWKRPRSVLSVGITESMGLALVVVAFCMSVLVLLSLHSFVGLVRALVMLFRWGCEPLRLRLACLRVGESGIAEGLASFDVDEDWARPRAELCIGRGGGFWENMYFEVSKRESFGVLRSV